MSAIETKEFNLAVARNEEMIGLSGELLYILDIPAGVEVKVRFNDLSEPKTTLLKGRQYKGKFSRLYLTNTAQTGTLSVIISSDPSVTIEDTDTPKPASGNTDPNTSLVYDKNQTAIQGALEPIIGHLALDLGVSSVRSSADFQRKVIRLYSTVDCYIKLGDATVVAVDYRHILPAKTIEYFSVGSNTRIAARVASGTGLLYISEMG